MFVPSEKAERSHALEQQAVALWRQYGLFLPKQARAFFKDLAEFLGWENLKEATK
jgi:hypothetical protein